MEITLAEALLRRKELQEQVDQLRRVKDDRLFKVVVKRQPVNENFDDVVASVPRVSTEQVTAAFNWHSKQLRRIDAVIQQTNWTTKVEIDGDVMGEYVEDAALKDGEIPVQRER